MENKIDTQTYGHQIGEEVGRKRLLYTKYIYQSLWLCGSQQTVENS